MALSKFGRLGTAALGVIAGVALAIPSSAISAGGGLKPSQAPSVEIGKHYFGDSNHESNNGNYVFDFWKLPPVLANDVLTIAWNDAIISHEMCVAIGIDDFNWAENECNGSNSAFVADSGSSRSTLQVNDSSASPYLELLTCCTGGKYDFVLESIQHAIGVDLHRVLRMRPKTTLDATAVLGDSSPVPDGLTFSLLVDWENRRGVDQDIQVDASTSGGELAFPLTLPRSAQGRTVTARVTRAADPEFLAAESAALDIEVVKARPSPVFMACRKRVFRALRTDLRKSRRMNARQRRRSANRAFKLKRRRIAGCRARVKRIRQRRRASERGDVEMGRIWNQHLTGR